MRGVLLGDDYIDPDVAYLLGLVVARGTLLEREGLYQVTVEFPFQHLEVQIEDQQGTHQTFNVAHSVHLGLDRIRSRIQELLDGDIRINETPTSRELVVRLTRRSIAWRTLLLHLEGKTSFRTMHVPSVLFSEDVGFDIRMEFVRGFADVAGNVRRANRYADERNRVRLDILNDNWYVPVELCRLLQQYLGVPVQLITWGHPNMGRGFREHQLNIFATPFMQIGFLFEHKQRILETLAEQDRERGGRYNGCPGRRRLRGQKPDNPDERDPHLPEVVRHHFDAYWQICKAIGCPIEPGLGPLFGSVEEEVEE